jgi:hypothetical protein
MLSKATTERAQGRAMGMRSMVLDTVAVETFARFAISRIFIAHRTACSAPHLNRRWKKRGNTLHRELPREIVWS